MKLSLGLTRVALAVTSACAVALVASPARANGRYPTAQYFLAGTGTAAGTLVLKSTFGLAVSDDYGASFRYLCEDALGYGSAAFDPAVGLLPDRTLIVGLSNGATHVSTDRCTFTPIPSLAGQYLTDFDVDPVGGSVVAATSTGFIDDFNHVWRSDDGGATFTALGPGAKGTLFVSVEMARTDPMRVYASALQLSPRKVIVFRSDDGGVTLAESTSFPYPDAEFAVVSGVDPSNRDVVYVRAEITVSAVRRTSLLRTADGGATWQELVTSAGEMLGFAPGDDAKTLWMGGPKDGLQRSDDGGETWTTLGSTQVQCLRWSDGILYVCGSERNDPDAGFIGDHFAVADSCDRGATLHLLLGFLEIDGPASCDPSSPESTSCPTRWDAPDSGVKWTFPTDDLPLEPLCSMAGDAGPLDASRDGTSNDAGTPDDGLVDAEGDVIADGTPDAGTSTPGGEGTSGGCGCGLGGVASGTGWVALIAASTLVALRVSRRPKRPS